MICIDTRKSDTFKTCLKLHTTERGDLVVCGGIWLLLWFGSLIVFNYKKNFSKCLHLNSAHGLIRDLQAIN